MGIKYLNTYLQNRCPEAINCLHLSELHGKKIVIDVSIYMYKYETDGLLLENMYLLISIMRYYGIIPIFIFDGKSPAEKKDLIEKRAEVRSVAKAEINILKEIISKGTIKDVEEKQEILATIDQLKKKTTQMNRRKIDKIKTLMRAYGVTYFDAHGEADQLCAMLTIKEKVWACMSEDMDMFVYGCPRVLRYVSLVQHTAVLYDTNYILNSLDMTQTEFSDICILSGTDYNIKESTVNLKNTLKHFYQYRYTNTTNNNFYEWLINNTNYICNFGQLQKIHEMFDIDSEINNQLSTFDNILIDNGPIRQDELENIMGEDGFIFV